MKLIKYTGTGVEIYEQSTCQNFHDVVYAVQVKVFTLREGISCIQIPDMGRVHLRGDEALSDLLSLCHFSTYFHQISEFWSRLKWPLLVRDLATRQAI